MSSGKPPDDDDGDCGMDGPPRRMRTSGRRRLFPISPRSRTRSSKGPSTPGSSPPDSPPPPDPNASTPRPSADEATPLPEINPDQAGGNSVDPDETLEYDADYGGDNVDNDGHNNND